MPSRQIIAYGGSFERSLNNTTWARIPEAKGLGVPAVTQDYVDVTNLDSPDGFREYIKGLKDAGELSIPCGYTSAGFVQQHADNQAADAIYYRVTLKPAPDQSTGDVFTFRGFPTPSLEANDLGQPVGMTITIRTTGSFTFAAGTPAP